MSTLFRYVTLPAIVWDGCRHHRPSSPSGRLTIFRILTVKDQPICARYPAPGSGRPIIKSCNRRAFKPRRAASKKRSKCRLFVVSAVITSEKKLTSCRWRRAVSRSEPTARGRGMPMLQQYTEGTLIIDFVDGNDAQARFTRPCPGGCRQSGKKRKSHREAVTKIMPSSRLAGARIQTKRAKKIQQKRIVRRASSGISGERRLQLWRPRPL